MNRLLAIELNGKWSCSNDGRIIVTRINTYSFLHNSIEFTKLTYSADKSKADNNNVKRIWNKSDSQCEYFLVLCMNTTNAMQYIVVLQFHDNVSNGQVMVSFD